jgi:hypothetical protein
LVVNITVGGQYHCWWSISLLVVNITVGGQYKAASPFTPGAKAR